MGIIRVCLPLLLLAALSLGQEGGAPTQQQHLRPQQQQNLQQQYLPQPQQQQQFPFNYLQNRQATVG